MASIKDFKEYAKLMPDDTDPTIQLCYDAAVQHAKDVGIPDFLFRQMKSDPKLDLYIYALATHWYDKRSFEIDGFVQEQSSKMRRELMYKQEPPQSEIIEAEQNS